MALKIVDADRKGDYLYITIQGDNITEVTSSVARKMAYEARGDHGFDNAGVEAFGGPYPVDSKAIDDENEEGTPVTEEKMAEISARPKDLRYRNTFRITRSPI